MKKSIAILLFLACLSFNQFRIIPVIAATTFKEGIYQLSDFNISPNNTYTIKNISPDHSVYIILFDESQRQIQSINLSPNSPNYSLIPIQPNYRVAVIGNGEVIVA